MGLFIGNVMENAINLKDLNGKNGFTLSGYQSQGQSGVSVSGIGDFNGDGINDFIIGAYNALYASDDGFGPKGQSYLVFGSKEGFDASFDLSKLNGINGFALNGYKSWVSSTYKSYLCLSLRSILFTISK